MSVVPQLSMIGTLDWAKSNNNVFVIVQARHSNQVLTVLMLTHVNDDDGDDGELGPDRTGPLNWFFL